MYVLSTVCMCSVSIDNY